MGVAGSIADSPLRQHIEQAFTAAHGGAALTLKEVRAGGVITTRLQAALGIGRHKDW